MNIEEIVISHFKKLKYPIPIHSVDQYQDHYANQHLLCFLNQCDKPELAKKSQKNKQRKYFNIYIGLLPPLEVEQCVRVLKQSHWQISKITAVTYPAKSYIKTNNLCRNRDHLNKTKNGYDSLLLGKIQNVSQYLAGFLMISPAMVLQSTMCFLHP